MSRVLLPSQDELQHCEPIFREIEASLGFRPNDYLTMSHEPHLLKAMVDLSGTVLNKLGPLPDDVKWLLPYIVSHAAHCTYCMAHSKNMSASVGVALEKIQSIKLYKTSPLFSDAERSALHLAEKSTRRPGAVTDQDLEELRNYFDSKQIVQIVALIALTAFYNKWNEIMATELEISSIVDCD